MRHNDIKKLIGKEDPVILEIGAHKGTDTRRFLSEFKHIRLYCFEPDPRNIQVFKININDTRCKLVEAAVSACDGEITLHMSSGYNPGRWWRLYPLLQKARLTHWISRNKDEWDLSSSIKESISHAHRTPWLHFPHAVRVRAVALDSWIREEGLAHIHFIWSDVQGAERDMVEGARDTLKKVDYLLMEYGETNTYPQAMGRRETIMLMKLHGTSPVISHPALPPGNLRVDSRPDSG